MKEKNYLITTKIRYFNKVENNLVVARNRKEAVVKTIAHYIVNVKVENLTKYSESILYKMAERNGFIISEPVAV